MCHMQITITDCQTKPQMTLSRSIANGDVPLTRLSAANATATSVHCRELINNAQTVDFDVLQCGIHRRQTISVLNCRWVSCVEVFDTADIAYYL